jgi:hypothetical protein
VKQDAAGARALAAQVLSNRSGVGHAESFVGHRERLTREIVGRAPPGGAGRLALLGAGNAHDVDLSALGAAYAEVHLVDVDVEAVERARAAAPAAVRARLRVAAPVDVSGFWPSLERWQQRPPASEALAEEVRASAGAVIAAVPGAPFDVVVSCCLLTQLQLVLLEALGDGVPQFAELRKAVSAIHVRALVGLTAAAGTALLVTELVSSDTYALLDFLDEGADLGRLMSDVLHANNVIHVAHPGVVSAELRRDPDLRAATAVHFPVGPWLWKNGPDMTFLVYAMEIKKNGP